MTEDTDPQGAPTPEPAPATPPLQFKPGRSLPIGRQYIGFDRAGGQAAARRRRQHARLAEQRLRRAVASGQLTPPLRPVSDELIRETATSADAFFMREVEST